MRKNYILDANILLHDPHSIFHFADNVVIIPVDVISEIDRFKKERTDRGYNARNVVRLLDGLRGKAGSLMQGVELDHGGLLRVYCEPDRVMTPNHSGADVEILRTARRIQDAEPDRPAIIVTKDINLRIRADAIGLRAEDYESDRVKLSEVYSGQVELEVTGAQLALFREHGALNTDRPLAPNEYALLRTTEGNRASALARADGSGRRLAALHEASSLWGVKPRNKEQYFAIDALLDDDIKLVTLLGKAGTGKTLLAIAAAMQLTLKLKRYRGMLVCRPIVPLGRDIGYLPGDIGQKLDPWMKPIADTVEFLLDAGGEVKGFRDADGLIGEGPIEIMPLTFVRGRSIANRFVVIDEAQNLTPLEVKTVITRMGVGAKVVLTGDPYQIDNPYVDANSNGFTYLINHFRGEAIAAHIELRKGERSALAELAANLL